MIRNTVKTLSCFFILALAACGGGGGGGGSDTILGGGGINDQEDSPNTPPEIDAGANRQIDVGLEFTLRATATDSGDTFSVSWKFSRPKESASALSDPTVLKPSFTPDVPGPYEASLTVTDSAGNTAVDSVTITAVLPANEAPTIDAFNVPALGAVNNDTALSASASDPDGDSLAFAWSFDQKPGASTAILDTPSTAQTSFTPDLAGNYVVRLTVSDNRSGNAKSVARSATVVVTGNAPPTADAGSGGRVATGMAVSLDGSGSRDPDGTIASYSWSLSGPPASTAGIDDAAPADPLAEFTPDLDGDYTITLTVTDDNGAMAEDTATFTAAAPPPSNQAPVAIAGPDRLVALGTTVEFNGGDSVDPEESALTYSWSLTPPAGSTAVLSSETARTPSLTPDVAGTYEVSLIVNDGNIDSAADSATIEVESNLVKILRNTGSDIGVSALETRDGGFALLAESDSVDLVGEGRGIDLILFKYDAAGNEEWPAAVTFGGPLQDAAWDLKEGPNDELIVAGRLETDIGFNGLLAGVDSSGVDLVPPLNADFGGDQWDQVQAFEETAAGYVFAGFTQSLGDEQVGDAWLVETDPDGAILNQVRFGDGSKPNESALDDGWGVKSDGSGGYFLVGETQSLASPGNSGDLLLGRVDGSFQKPTGWPRTYNGAAGGLDQGFDLEVVSDGVVLAGYTEVPAETEGLVQGQAWMFKVDSSGNQVANWGGDFGDEGLEEARALTSLGNGFALAGRTNSDRFTTAEALEAIYLVRTNMEGGVQWERSFKLPGTGIAYSLASTRDGGFLLAGTTNPLLRIQQDGTPSLDDEEIVLLKTDFRGNLAPVFNPETFVTQEDNEEAFFSFGAGAAFTDYNGDALTFRALGLPVGLTIDPATGSISGTLPAVEADTSLRVTVIASDNGDADAPESFSAAGTFTLLVLNVN